MYSYNYFVVLPLVTGNTVLHVKKQNKKLVISVRTFPKRHGS